jgi:hypothetical protein
MARFYVTKRYGYASLYQFAIGESWRGKGLLKKMLFAVCDKPIVSKCPKDAGLNEYFRKTRWTLKSQDEGFKYWQLAAAKGPGTN